MGQMHGSRPGLSIFDAHIVMGSSLLNADGPFLLVPQIL